MQKTKKVKKKVVKIKPWEINKFNLRSLEGVIGCIDNFKETFGYLTERQLQKHFPDMYELSLIRDHLYFLNNMVGMKEIKQQVIDQILLNIQELNDIEMLHTVIFGPPGVGKTCIAYILADIYSALGWLSVGNVFTPKRNDLVGRYLGETADKTKKYLDKCKGSVCFIDEVYSLGGNDDGKDSFAKEAVDTINQFLSEEAHDFVCIIAGYERSVKKCFFEQNEGLERRFPWRFTVNNYKGPELEKIFRLQIINKGWELDEKINISEFFKDNKFYAGNGGDTMNFFSRCIVAHSTRIFGKTECVKKQFTYQDIKQGYEAVILTKKVKNNGPPFNMYI